MPLLRFTWEKLIMRLREDSQCKKILDRLQAQGGEGWVSMPDLVAISGSFNVHSRIDELRSKHGIEIHNEVDLTCRPHVSRYWVPDNGTHSPATP